MQDRISAEMAANASRIPEHLARERCGAPVGTPSTPPAAPTVGAGKVPIHPIVCRRCGTVDLEKHSHECDDLFL